MYRSTTLLRGNLESLEFLRRGEIYRMGQTTFLKKRRPICKWPARPLSPTRKDIIRDVNAVDSGLEQNGEERTVQRCGLSRARV